MQANYSKERRVAYYGGLSLGGFILLDLLTDSVDSVTGTDWASSATYWPETGLFIAALLCLGGSAISAGRKFSNSQT